MVFEIESDSILNVNITLKVNCCHLQLSCSLVLINSVPPSNPYVTVARCKTPLVRLDMCQVFMTWKSFERFSHWN